MWFARILFALCVLPTISHAADCSLKPPRPALVQIDYKGGCQGGFAHGRGVALYQVTDQTKDDVIRHEGEFVNGVANGQTTYSSRSGQFGFRGEFRNWRPYEGIAFQPSAFGQFLEVTYRNGDIASKEYKSRSGSAPPQVAHQPTGPNPLAMLLERALSKKLNQAQQQPADSIRQQAADADAAIRQQSQAANAYIANQAREADAQSRASIAAADAQSRANIAIWDAQGKAKLAQQSADARALIQSQSRAADAHIANQAREAEAQSRASIAAADAQSKANIAIWDAQAKARREVESAESKALIERQTALAAAAVREQSRASDARMAAQYRELEEQRKRQEAAKVTPPPVIYSAYGTAPTPTNGQSDTGSAQQSTPRTVVAAAPAVSPNANSAASNAAPPALSVPPELGTRNRISPAPTAETQALPAPSNTGITNKAKQFVYDCKNVQDFNDLGRRWTEQERAFVESCKQKFLAEGEAAANKDKWLGRAETAAKIGEAAGNVANSILVFVPGGAAVGTAEKAAAATIKSSLAAGAKKEAAEVAVVKTEKAIGSAVGRADTNVLKSPPNPYGKLGGPQHQAEVAKVTDDVADRGLIAESEFRINTPIGEKTKRFADVVGKDPETGRVKEIHQIGKQTKSGQPVKREREAMRDIEQSKDIPVQFHPYNKN